MKVMKKASILILLLGVLACGLFRENGIKFELYNNTHMPVTNVRFTTSEKLETVGNDRVEPNEYASGFLSMKNNRTDGAYVLEFTRSDGKEEKRSAGYYTNGGSLNKLVRFEIKPDTVIVKFE